MRKEAVFFFGLGMEFRTKVAGVAVMTNGCALWARHYVKSLKFNLQSNLGEGTDNVKFKEED